LENQSTPSSAVELNTLAQAQQDMRTAYFSGATGAFVSGTVWCVAGVTALFVSEANALWTLLIGGVLIHPVSIVVNKMLGASASHAKTNPLAGLAMQGTFFMIMAMIMLVVYALTFEQYAWFFQGMLLIIGGRYLTFVTLYGLKHYWVLGFSLAIAAYLLFQMKASTEISAITGGVVEIIFSLVIFLTAKK